MDVRGQEDARDHLAIVNEKLVEIGDDPPVMCCERGHDAKCGHTF
jgi:hypothetical protein